LFYGFKRKIASTSAEENKARINFVIVREISLTNKEPYNKGTFGFI